MQLPGRPRGLLRPELNADCVIWCQDPWDEQGQFVVAIEERLIGERRILGTSKVGGPCRECRSDLTKFPTVQARGLVVPRTEPDSPKERRKREGERGQIIGLDNGNCKESVK